MGQQQLLLIILGVIIVGIAIAVGITMFSAQSISANKDTILSDINNLAADIHQYRIRPTSMGGGGGTPDTYLIKPLGAWGTNNPSAVYTFTPDGAGGFSLIGVSRSYGPAQITCTFDNSGLMVGTPVYTGVFL